MFGPIYPSGLSEKDQNVKSLFVRKRSKCEKLTDDGHRVMGNYKLTQAFGCGELINHYAAWYMYE